MTSHNDSNIAPVSISMDWGIDMIEPLEEDVLEKDDLLMFDCFDPDELDSWLDNATQMEADTDPKEDKDISSPMNEENTQETRQKRCFSRRSSISKRSVSPPSKRQHRTEEHEMHTQNILLTPPESPQTVKPTSSQTSNSKQIQSQYDEMMEKLALSMKKSEESRARVIRCQNPSARPASSALRPSISSSSREVPSTQSMPSSGLASFLSGKSTSLTAGLEQSRKEVQAYMNQMNMITI